MIRFLWPGKPVNKALLSITPKPGCDWKPGRIYHKCFGIWLVFKGDNIIYTPFGNGYAVKISGAQSLSLDADFWYCPTLYHLRCVLHSLSTKGGA